MRTDRLPRLSRPHLSRPHLSRPRLMAISDRRLLAEDGAGRPDWGAWLSALADAGVDTVQLREKDLPARRLYELALLVRRAWNGLLLVNGRADVALAAGADGVHLPAAELPLAALRRRYGAGLLLGRSTHHPDEVAAALEDGADYVTFGPVFPTPSKERYGTPPGLDGLRAAIATGLPVLALGGVGGEEIAAVASAGAAGVAGIRVFHEPESLARLSAAAREIRGVLCP